MQPYSDTTIGQEVDEGSFKDNEIRGNHITNSKIFGIELYGNASECIISGNTLVKCGLYKHGGIVIKYSSNNVIYNNTISKCYKGIEVIGSPIRPAKNNMFIWNRINSSLEAGLLLWGDCTDNGILGNTVSYSYSGISVYGDDGKNIGFSKRVIISDNKCISNLNDGIQVTNGFNFIIQDNSCYNNNRENNGSGMSSGIRIINGSYNNINNNICLNSKNQRYGIYLASGSNNIVSNNICKGNLKRNIEDKTGNINYLDNNK